MFLRPQKYLEHGSDPACGQGFDSSPRYKCHSQNDLQVTYSNAYGVFTGSHELTTTNKKKKVEKVTADRFIIATGLRPRYPDVPGAKECCISR